MRSLFLCSLSIRFRIWIGYRRWWLLIWLIVDAINSFNMSFLPLLYSWVQIHRHLCSSLSFFMYWYWCVRLPRRSSSVNKRNYSIILRCIVFISNPKDMHISILSCSVPRIFISFFFLFLNKKCDTHIWSSIHIWISIHSHFKWNERNVFLNMDWQNRG